MIYYISSAATNGYVVGHDVNDGLSKSTPWRTLDPMNAPGFTWDGSDVVYVNGDTECSEQFVLDNDLELFGELDAADNRPELELLSVNAGGETNALAFNGGFSLKTTNLVINGIAASTAVLRLDHPSVAGAVELVRSRVEYTSFGIYASDGAIDLTIDDCEIASETNENCAVYLDDLLTGADIDIDGLKLLLKGQPSANRGGVYIEGNAAGVSASVKRVHGFVTSTRAAPEYVYGVYISDCDTALIDNCNLTVTPHAVGSATLYRISNPNITNVSGAITNNGGFCNSDSGIIIHAGSDSTIQLSHGIEVHGNRVRGPVDYVSLHGILAGNCNNANVYNNSVDYAAIAFISKESNGHVFSHNVTRFCNSTAVAYQLKGADNARFVNNLHVVEGDWSGKTFLIHANVTNHTNGAEIHGNARHVAPGATFYSNFVTVEASSDASFSGNVWHVSPPGLFPNTPFSYQGSTFSLDDWNAEANVAGDTSFEFSALNRTRIDNRLLVTNSYVD